jgi:YcxB-like protein
VSDDAPPRIEAGPFRPSAADTAAVSKVREPMGAVSLPIAGVFVLAMVALFGTIAYAFMVNEPFWTVAGVISALCVIPGAVFYRRVLVARMTEHLRLRSPAHAAETTISCDPAGFSVTSPLIQMRASWRTVLNVRETPTHIVLLVNPASGHVIPKSLIEPGARDTAFETIRGWWRDGSTPV